MRRCKGFTLIELLIVVAIIAILAAIAIPNFLNAQVRANVSRCKADLRNLGGATVAYVLDNGVPPPDRTDQYWMGVAPPWTIMQWLTSPISYIKGMVGADPFITSAQEGYYLFVTRTEYQYDSEWAPFPGWDVPWSYDHSAGKNRNFDGWNTESFDWDAVNNDNNPLRQVVLVCGRQMGGLE